MILSYPSIINNEKNIHKNGIDIVVLLDISGSMDAQDLHPSRIEAAKKGLLSFIEKLKTDRLGLIVFAGKPFISLPLTFDYNILKESISSLNTTTINQQQVGLNGTAIGDALLMAKILFKKPKDLSLDEYKKREKVVVLLTDGDANVGIDPGVAAQVLKEEGIKVYAIGIGSQEGGVIHYNVGPFIQEQKIPPLNDNALNNITNMTQGEYFRVSNNQVFEEVFQKLAQLEKNDINIQIIQGYIPVITPLIYVLLFLIFCIICSEFFILHTKH